MRPPTIMIVGRRCEVHEKLKRLFRTSEINTVTVEDYRQTDRLMNQHRPGVVVCTTAGRSAGKVRDMLTAIRQVDPHLPIILIARRRSESTVIAALRAGATDYFRWPVAKEDFSARCLQFLQKRARPDYDSAPGFQAGADIDRSMIGNTPAMYAIKSYIHKVAQTDSTVLITGETGTGKDLAAEWIHRQSSRGAKPLIRVNCAAMPEGLVESELFGHERGAFTGALTAKRGKFVLAGSGSLFLDEIGEMQPYAQAKILHCIESKKVYPLGAKDAVPLNSRVIAATNQDPENLILDGKFREDLYYRLNVGRIHLPPLRERREDIPELIACGIRRLNRKFNRAVSGLREDVIGLLRRYEWPGNVRELMNVLEGAFINMPADHIEEADLPAYFKKKLANSQHMPADERKRILAALLETNWNKSTAAAKLNWSRMTLYRKMTKYHIVENRKPLR